MTIPPGNYQWKPGYQAILYLPADPGFHGKKVVLDFESGEGGWGVTTEDGTGAMVDTEALRFTHPYTHRPVQMMPDPTLEDLFKAATIGLRSSPRDLTPLRMLGDYYEEHGHTRCAHPCRESNPAMVPLLSYLVDQGMTEEQARSIRQRWLEELR